MPSPSPLPTIPSCLQFLSIPSPICCTLLPESSIINEVIRAVLNFLCYFIIFFLQKFFARTKNTKNTKSTKSTKNHQKYKKAHKRNQAKTQNANKRTKIKNALKKNLSGKKTYSLICVFCVFCARKERKIENRKNQKSLQCNVLNTNVPINHFRKSS